MLTPELVLDATMTPAEQEEAAWEHWGSALTRALETMTRSAWARSTLAWHIWRAARENLINNGGHNTHRGAGLRERWDQMNLDPTPRPG
jgi:hypothetical protein